MTNPATVLKENCIQSLQSTEIPLHKALLSGDIDTITNSADDVNQINEKGFTALHAAIALDQAEIVQILLDKGASLTALYGGFTPLGIAVACDNLPIVQVLLNNGADINALSHQTAPALFIAIALGNVPMVQFLVNEAKADVNLTKDGYSLLHLAASINNAEIVQCLVDAGADINIHLNDSLITPLMAVASLGSASVAQILLDAGANIADTALNGDTALHLAAATDNDEVAALLIDKGINLESTVKNGETALILAARAGSAKVVSLLLDHHANVNAANKSNISALHAGVESGNAKIVQNLIAAGADINALTADGDTPLVLALKAKKTDMVQTLLDAGADTYVAKNEVFTHAYIAASTGDEQATQQLAAIMDAHSAAEENAIKEHFKDFDNNKTLFLLGALKNKNTALVQILLDEGVDVTILGDKIFSYALLATASNDAQAIKQFETIAAAQQEELSSSRVAEILSSSGILHEVIRYGNIEDVAFLIEKGIDIEARQKSGNTALHTAIEVGSIDMVSLLLKHHADISATTGLSDWTALHLAAIHYHAEMVALLIEKGISIEATDNCGNTALHTAAAYTAAAPMHIAVKTISVLLEHHANIAATDEFGETALHKAAHCFGMATWCKSAEAVQKLIASGADVNAIDKKGNTPLVKALQSKSISIIQALLDAGADPTIAHDKVVAYAYLAMAQNYDVPQFEMIAGTSYETLSPSYIAEILSNARVLHDENNYCDPNFATLCIEKGINIEATDEYGRTALHCAVGHQQTKFIQKLLEAGANVNAIDADGDTPLRYALCKFTTPNYNEIVQLLIDAGADTTGYDLTGYNLPDTNTVVTDPSATVSSDFNAEPDAASLLQEATTAESTPPAEESDIASMPPIEEMAAQPEHLEL